MYLEQIAIQNFRCFKSINLVLNPGLNLLVGENDSGKTTIIDAIRCVLGTTSSDRIFVGESDFHEDATSLSIELRFVDVDNQAHVFVEHLTHEVDPVDRSKRRSVLYVHLLAENKGLEKRGYPYIKTEVKSGKNGNGVSIESDIRDFLSTTYLKPLRDAEDEMSSGRGSRLSQILNSEKEIIDPASIEMILSLIAQTNSELVKEKTPIHNTSLKIQNDYLHKLIFEKDKEVLKAIIDIAGIKNLSNLSGNQKRRLLRSVLEGLNLYLTQEQRKHGLGYNNLLFIATELLLLEQGSDSEYSLLLLEEPEAHLHPQLQMKLLQFISQKSDSTINSPGIQCIVTTHSPNISSKANPKSITIISQGKAFPLRREETELIEEDYVFLQKFLDVTKANVFFARGLILVEGDAESILLPTIAELLGRPFENYGVSVINIQNTAWKRFAKLFLRKNQDIQPDAWIPVKVAVLRDLDLWPDCAEKLTENPYGFIERKDRNKHYWESNVEDVADHIEKLKVDRDGQSLERQNLRISISDKWTFEYCLAYCGLFDECYEIINGSPDGQVNITGSMIEKSTYIMSKVDKTDFAYEMAILLERKYKGKVAELKSKLPPYIVNAIEYVTAPV